MYDAARAAQRQLAFVFRLAVDVQRIRGVPLAIRPSFIPSNTPVVLMVHERDVGAARFIATNFVASVFVVYVLVARQSARATSQPRDGKSAPAAAHVLRS